ncbi:ABC transporter permease [Stutzerimonas kirkiae]|uniref:ABC transporter permease n=1 Tax=Stutzerimonas kirkiae TaxID=2211392 RepID=A0A4Q9QYF2_9GAMM|nr:ABC transporter permease [Stutzerimonas kirkiae]TBU90330.1 ABC transporter permease [Stutzerimonas kirkiae]TBU98001.1 ABC transporter permease [Stutzerimonas kirkiae]TBV12308.1 ABC transporter permease [Stutzerimonas kirkiae]TBV13188.1 ABC transporter permease [Stutzerimonas kirkiae]
MNNSRKSSIESLMPWVTTLVLLLLWQIVSLAMGNASLMLPAPTEIARSLIEHYDVIWPNALHTLYTTGLGFAFAVVFGMLFGLAIGASPLIYRGFYPLLIAFNAVPKVALVPIFVLWFGIGAVPAMVTAFSLAVFPIIVNVATGLSTIDPEMEDVMRSLGARRLDILTKIGIPRMTPYLFASLKISITLAFVGSVLSETIASNEGIGFLMQAASSRFDVPLVFAGLIVIAAMAVLAYQACVLIEKRFTRWATRGK